MICKTILVHDDAVRRIRAKMPDDDMLERTAAFFKAFSEPTRLRIIQALRSEELCVCDLAMIIGSSQSAVSHQLAKLKQARLVTFRKEGKVVFYRLDDEHVQNVLDYATEHMKHA